MLSTLMMMTTAAIAGQIDPLTHLGSLTEGLRSPARVAAAPDGTVLVADAFHNHIVHFGAGGAVMATWPVSEGPIGIAAHPDGRYFVSLRDEGTVGIYDATFARIDSLGDGQVTWSQPTDIDVDAVSGRIYVVDSGADRVYAFESGGALALMVGVRGHGSGQFRYPSAIAVDAANSRFFVADQDNFRVQAFDATTGLFQFQFGYRIKYTPTSEEGWFQRTQGLALDPSGRIYVADALMSTVRLFDGSGSEIAKVIEYGFAAGDVRTPCDLIVNSDGSRLYVASTNTASVEVYEVAPFPVPLPSGGPTEGANDSGYDRMRRGRFALHDRLGRSGGKRPQSLDGVSLGDTGIPVAQQTPDADGMHIIEEPFICARCHDVDGQPGGHLGLAEGNTVVCMSCHTAGGQALHQSIHERDLADPYGSNPLAVNGRGRSHAWGVPAVSVEADSVGPIADSPMAQHLDGGLIKCSTCHEQHDAEPWAPYLRVNNNDDAMCKQCHAPRSEGPGQRGTHWVGFEYPAGVGEYPPAAAIAPFVLKGGDMECLTCHAVHDADSGGRTHARLASGRNTLRVLPHGAHRTHAGRQLATGLSGMSRRARS